MRRILAAWLVVLAGHASAACVVQPLAGVPVDPVGTTLLVPVVVNGIEGSFILDTGAGRTVVTPEAVARFGLALDEWTSTTMRGVGGVERRRNANPRSLTLGGIALKRRSLAEDSTLRAATLPRASAGGRTIDGLLGRDFLSVFDLMLDIRHRVLALYDVRDCSGRFLPWTGDYVSVPVENPTESALIVPIELDGVKLRALLDSGAGSTVVAAPGMARLGLTAEALAGDPVHTITGMGPNSVAMRRHRFGHLKIGTETFSAPVFLVGPIQLTPVADLLLGADWLMPRRVWISYATRQLFVARDR